MTYFQRLGSLGQDEDGETRAEAWPGGDHVENLRSSPLRVYHGNDSL